MGAPLWGQSVCGTPLLEIPLLGHLCVGTPLCVGKPLYVGTYLCVGHLRVGAPLCAGHLCVGDTFCVAGTFVCEAPLCGGTFVWGNLRRGDFCVEHLCVGRALCGNLSQAPSKGVHINVFKWKTCHESC